MIGLPNTSEVRLYHRIYRIYLLLQLIVLADPQVSTVFTLVTANRRFFTSHHQEWNPTRACNETSSTLSARSLNDNTHLRAGCRTAEDDLDRCSAQLLALGLSDVSFPSNMNSLNSVYCPNFKSVVSCIKESTDCYRPFERQIINWILTSTRRVNYKRCKNENEKVKFLRLTSSCFSLMKNPMDKCMTNYVSSLESIAELSFFMKRSSDSDYQIQLSCCANKRFKECVMSNAKQMCKPLDSLNKLKRTNSVTSHRSAQKRFQRSMSDTIDDLKSTLDDMNLTGPELICRSIDERFCRSKFDGRFNGRLTKHKSIVPAMIKIYSNK